jgi:hypothetical protein
MSIFKEKLIFFCETCGIFQQWLQDHKKLTFHIAMCVIKNLFKASEILYCVAFKKPAPV